MNEWAAYKPILTALALPPVPFLVLILAGAYLASSRRTIGRLVVWMAVCGLWLSACQGCATWLQDQVLKPAPPLLGERQLVFTANKRGDAPSAAIIVLGGGRDLLSTEYGLPDLSTASAERLRYGIWLSRQMALPLGVSGGVGWAQQGAAPTAPEAEVAATIAREQYAWPLRWVEGQSADTRGNAVKTVAMLSGQGVYRVVLVTHAYHMHRAMKVFQEAARPHSRSVSPGHLLVASSPSCRRAPLTGDAKSR
jgi:uncharacterized SAM-binding protein YcdF (DUF218 family)